MKRFTGHDKRVTLSLARCSAVCLENEELMTVLQKLPGLGYDLDQLTKPELELLYAEFDEELEEKIKAEFQADPGYLVDLGHAYGVCPLCGHVGCRWIFRIENVAGGQPIECGSECIITHGLCVKGAETAEHAKKALESAIRRQIRKLQIQAWHEEYDFNKGHFDALSGALLMIVDDCLRPRWVNKKAFFMRKVDLPKLRRFYQKTGWLGTEKRWKEWCRLVNFVWKQAATHPLVPRPKPWVPKPKKSKSKKSQQVGADVEHETKKDKPKSGQAFLPGLE